MSALLSSCQSCFYCVSKSRALSFGSSLENHHLPSSFSFLALLFSRDCGKKRLFFSWHILSCPNYTVNYASGLPLIIFKQHRNKGPFSGYKSQRLSFSSSSAFPPPRPSVSLLTLYLSASLQSLNPLSQSRSDENNNVLCWRAKWRDLHRESLISGI